MPNLKKLTAILLTVLLALSTSVLEVGAEEETVTELAKLLASDGASEDNFGYSVALNGD